MTEKPIVAIPSDDPPQCQGSPWLTKLQEKAEVRLFTDRPVDFEEQLERARGASAIINSRSYIQWPREAIEQLPDLGHITVCGIGTDSIDLDAAREHGVLVSNIPGRTAPVVAEHSFALMWAISKRLAWYLDSMRAGLWTKMDGMFLAGKTIGIIGTGNIGAEMARLCGAVGMNVIAWTFNPSDERAAALGVEYVELSELLSRSDVISIHIQQTPESYHMLGERELAMTKPGALLVNAARGPIVDEVALVNALNSGHLGGAALDVFEEEPLRDNHPLLDCEHVILTPHIADMTPEGLDLLNQGVVENTLAFLDGSPQNIVNL